LTTAGIVIGVTTVTGVASLVQGLNDQVTNALGGMGARTIYIQKFPAIMTGGGERRRYWRRSNFTVMETSVLSGLDGVLTAVPIAEWFTQVETTDGENLMVSLIGTSADWPEVSHRSMTSGRFFTPYEVSSRRKVCVIGAKVAERLFGTDDPVGETVDLEGRQVTVIGVAQAFGEIMGQSQDAFVVVPWTIFGDWRDYSRSLSIAVEAEPGADVQKVLDEVQTAMRRLRGLTINEDNDFEMVTADQLLDTYRKISSGIFAAMLAISAMALLVGSVGIANIMLVSVTERTREIGLRKAMGATNGEILIQFLVESTILSLVGGAIGILLGASAAVMVAKLTPVPAGLQAWSVAVALAASTMVGVAAGAFPAVRAARLEPVRALGYNN